MRQVALLLLPALTAALQLSGFDFSLLPSLAGTPIPSKVPPSALHLSSNSSSSSANGGISTEPLSCFTRDVYFLVLDGVVLTARYQEVLKCIKAGWLDKILHICDEVEQPPSA